MNRKQVPEGLAGKSKDDNSNLPLTEDRQLLLQIRPQFELPFLGEANWAFRISALIAHISPFRLLAW
jgi:hypothetical protein